MARTGESRWWLLSALLASLTAQLIIAFALEPDTLPAISLGTTEGLVIAITCALGLLVALAYTRTAAERDRAETLHWESMEMIRSLSNLRASLKEDCELDEALERLLDLGRKRFGAELGLISKIHGDRYEVIAARGPHDEGLSCGTVLPLSDTFCERVFATRRTLSFSNAETPVWSDHPAKLALGFGSYLGAVVHVGGGRFGTLCFASGKAARTPFTATQRDLASLLAQWVGFEIDRSVANKVVWSEVAAATRREALQDLDIEIESASPRAREHQHKPATQGSAPRTPSVAEPQSGLDVNAALKRMKSLLEQCAGEKIELTLTLATDLRAARAPGVAFRQLVLGIVRHAAASMPEGGKLELETGRVGPAGASNGPANEAEPDPTGFVTLAVRDTGGEVDAGDMGANFEAAFLAGAEDSTTRSSGAALSLSEIERILRSGGADLSVAVEPGRGTTYTVFLPEALPMVLREFEAEAKTRSPAATPAATASTDPLDGAEAPAPKTQLSFLP